MSERSFTHLHTHTEFSMLDGAARVGDLVAAAVADGQPALGITDHGNMYGVLDFYKACRDQGIIPIIGTEAYMAGESRHERPVRRGRVDDTGGDVEGGQKLYYHLTLLAETVEGYRNLMKLSSAAYLEGYYYKPRVDWELLERHHDGLIATTGCLGGVVLQALLAGDVAEAERRAARLQDIFGRDNLFVELQDHGIADQHRTNPQLIEIARRIGAPLLATNDSHYTHREDAVAHDALLCVQTGALLARHQPLQVRGHRALPEDARPRCATCSASVPEACDNTLLIAERADVEIELGQAEPARVPGARARSPATTYEERAQAYLRDLTMRGRAAALRRPAAARGGASGSTTSSASSATWASPPTSSSCGTSSASPGSRGIRVGPGPRLGGRLLRRLLPAHRRPRPDPLRPALRALLEPGPQADARHRHGLRRALPRRDDPLRRRAVRQRPGGPDRHVLDDQGPGRRARRRPGARQAVRRGRPDRQGDAAARHGPRHAAARLPRPRPRGTRTATPPPAELRDDVRDGPRREGGHRRRAGPRGPAAPGRHPRRRGGDHPRPADRVPADPAQARRRRRTRGRARSSPSTRCTASRSSAC